MRDKLTAFPLCAALACIVFLAAFGAGPPAEAAGADRAIERIAPQEARRLVAEGQALLVCAYGDQYCSGFLLEGAILRGELEARADHLPKEQMIIFYCG